MSSPFSSLLLAVWATHDYPLTSSYYPLLPTHKYLLLKIVVFPTPLIHILELSTVHPQHLAFAPVVRSTTPLFFRYYLVARNSGDTCNGNAQMGVHGVWFVVHICTYPAKALVVCLLHNGTDSSIKSSQRYKHKSHDGNNCNAVACNLFYTLMNGFRINEMMVMGLLHFVCFCSFTILL